MWRKHAATCLHSTSGKESRLTRTQLDFGEHEVEQTIEEGSSSWKRLGFWCARVWVVSCGDGGSWEFARGGFRSCEAKSTTKFIADQSQPRVYVI